MANNWSLSSEVALERSLNDINRFWHNNVICDTFSGKDDLPISYAYAIPNNARSAVVLVNGRVETYLKYKEVIFDLFRNGFAIFTYDHRGQGLSGRMTEDPQQGYVKSFADYVSDFTLFLNCVVTGKWNDGLMLMAHSMGGAISTLYLLDNPNIFNKAVFCSPMYGIQPALPKWFARILLNAAMRRSRRRKCVSDYFFGQKPYTVHPFAINPLTHSKVRYKHILSVYEQFPHARLGGVTTQWLVAAIAAMDEIERRASQLVTSSLIFSSGKDRIIDNRRQNRVASSFQQSDCRIIQGAFHELLCESDEYRNQVLTASMDFFVQ